MDANEIRKALRKKYSDSRRFAVAEEVGLTTGFSHRRLDMMVLDCYNSNGFRIDGFEIKVSTSDLRRELEDPEKHIAFFDVIDYYTLVVPSGVVDPLIDVIPQKWGIMIVNDNGSIRMKRRPLALEDRKADKTIPREFFASVTRAIQGRQPAAQEIEDAYSKGFEEGQKRAEKTASYISERVKREARKLDAYEKLQARFRIWSEDDIDGILNEFEMFRKMDPDLIRDYIHGTIKRLENITQYLGEMGTEGRNTSHDKKSRP